MDDNKRKISGFKKGVKTMLFVGALGLTIMHHEKVEAAGAISGSAIEIEADEEEKVVDAKDSLIEKLEKRKLDILACEEYSMTDEFGEIKNNIAVIYATKNGNISMYVKTR